MNDLEKKSFYSFLGLYIVSSFLFISMIGFWYYTAQKHALENETHYKLEHLADKKAGELIMAHMHGTSTKKTIVPKDVTMALIDTKGNVVEGKLVNPNIKIKPSYFTVDDYQILISDAPREHMNISYVVVQSDTLKGQLHRLKDSVLLVVGIVLLIVMAIAWMLSKLFMKPVHERVTQIERFINDVTHELNTPITSLTMSADQALKAGGCSPKMLNNISISTKQLYDIYRSLTYLNFSDKQEIAEPLDIKEVLEESVAYYTPLAEIKRITFKVEAQEMKCVIPKSQLTLLLGNLIGNAIKYSSPRSTITIILKERTLKIIDEGIGIEADQQKEIFEKFKRGTEYSGGFGVGLNIVKSICNQYGIQIELDSKVDVGTEFRLFFK
ncbi:sensor histidine kinase [Sulfurovum sp. NBC37-1]|uniref:sensor histidine kinase n=1 Tax=Sulfurovum sp. (strain NBC37-1) TaxID=387093 RepID=UPI0001587476|nr:HAMP domain-containing sensor histidine kinase [Sulfurovum sp. NBC37-1]BAF71745.1 two-component sensor histidine kinase [Sulfurovum sp. NBC37-1]